MSNEFKEVWYVWDGAGKVPAAAKFEAVIDQDGVLIDGRLGDNHRYAVAMCCAYHASSIAAYTLGEMRRRVKCDECGGTGGEHGGLISFESIPCEECNGTGKVWEYKK